MSQDLDRLLEGHEYDGIQEFDNPLPGWWLFTFFATIIFSFIYYLHYEVANGPNQEAELKQSLEILQSLKKGGPAMDEEKLAALFKDSALETGKSTFQTKCAMCHGANGEGLIGPNLTDKHYIHGGTRLALYNVIAEGILDKGMPAWKEQLSSDEIVGVTYYVHKMKGTFAPNGKPPQGEEEK
jgi:cytochrome c oxidase cbb3-type subunit 3